jgi:hypothetical protein
MDRSAQAPSLDVQDVGLYRPHHEWTFSGIDWQKKT